MNIVTMTGTFRAKATDWGINVTSEKKCPQFSFVCQLTEYWDEEDQEWKDYSGENEGITAYLTLVSGEGKPLKNIEQIQKVFGWSGESFTLLAEGDYSDVEFQIRIEENNYEGAQCPFKVVWLDTYDSTPGRGVAKLDASGLKDLDKQFGAILKKNSGPAKPKSAPPKSPKDKATAKDEKPKSSKQETAEEKMERNRAQKEKDDAAKAKREANKAKLAAEKKAAADKKKAAADKKDKKSKMPAIGKAKTETEPTQEDDGNVTMELTQDEAWERICDTQAQVGEDCTDDDVQAALVEACQTVGENDEPDVEQFTKTQWGRVAELTIQTLVGV